MHIKIIKRVLPPLPDITSKSHSILWKYSLFTCSEKNLLSALKIVFCNIENKWKQILQLLIDSIGIPVDIIIIEMSSYITDVNWRDVASDHLRENL